MLAQAVLVLCSAIGLISPATLDLTELDTVQYKVEIRDSPVDDGQSEVSSVTMVNKDGQKYRCSLPPMPDPNEEEKGGEEATVPDISQLLAPLEAGPCLYKTKDWWTYEVCYKRSIKQYHVENDKPVGAIMVLGKHDPSQDVWERTNSTYLPQYYTNGTQCDLTSRPRQAQLRFVCNEAAVQELIGDIFEPQSCEYSIVIHTSRLCSVPWLRPVADPTPLPIVCQPLLSPLELQQYNLYLEKKKLADQLAAKKKEAEKSSEEKSPTEGGDGEERKTLEGLLASMSDNMADNLVTEISGLLDKAMAVESNGGLQVIDLREKKKENTEGEGDEEKEKKEKPTRTENMETKASEGWDLVHHKHNTQHTSSDPELRKLVSQRNDLWRKIHEAKKQVKKYTSQLHDTDTFLKNERADVFNNPDVVERLEFQKKTIEKALSKARDYVGELEVSAKDISHQLVAAQNRLMRTEEMDWTNRLTELQRAIKSGHFQIDEILTNIARDYRKVTKERLSYIDDYIKVAKKIVGNTFPAEDLSEIFNFLSELDGMLPLENEILDEASEELSDENLETASKFKDVIKDDIRTQFKDILKEVSEELDLSEGEVDRDEAMLEMSKTLDRLMTRIAGTGKAIDQAQKTVDLLKQEAREVPDTNEMSLKRDNKMSVKKDLSWISDEDNDEEEEGEEEEDEDDDMEELKATEELLDQAEAELSALEKEMKEAVKTAGDTDNVKVSVTNMSPGVETDEKTGEIVKKLEDTIKNKLSKLGVDTGGRPIEIKLITTQIPDGLPQGEDGDEAQVSSSNQQSEISLNNLFCRCRVCCSI